MTILYILDFEIVIAKKFETRTKDMRKCVKHIKIAKNLLKKT